MPTARWWKEFYAAERESLGRKGLEHFIIESPSVVPPKRGALIFPHTRLAGSGHLTAAAARAVIESGCETVLALGVLHGIPRDRMDLTGIHFDDELTRNEFSLDNFEVLLRLAANLFSKPMPKYLPAYPVWTGADALEPKDIPCFEHLRFLLQSGAALVATGDLVHHGIGYGTPAGLCLDIASPAAMDYSRDAIVEQFAALDARNYTKFLSLCERSHSDFRDVRPVLAALVPAPAPASILELTLVNYADVLQAVEPTWVAAALINFSAD